MSQIKEMKIDEFSRRLKGWVETPDSKFVFFLGAGCSVSSGIPDAGTLVRSWLPRLKKLKTDSEDDYKGWVKEIYTEYDDEKASSFYGRVIEDLFLTSAERQREIERLTEGKDPGFGYAVLAQLITNEKFCPHCSVVLTVNFDDLVADALYLYTNKKPLVISHDSLAGFVKITRTRPLIIKLHGDARLEPKNIEQETKDLPESVKKVLRNLLSETGLIFMGYGGNDESIAEILSELPSNALPWGIYWVGTKIPESKTGEWLKSRDAVWVNHLDFDELMLILWKEFNLSHPQKDRFDKLIETYYKTFEKLSQSIEAKPEETIQPLKEALDKARKDINSWWSVELEAEKYQKENPEKTDSIYQEGLKQFPNSAGLLGNYAIFLENIRKEYDKAEEYYRKALEKDPDDAVHLDNYANFLWKIRKDYDKAEEYYRKALEQDPEDANNLGNYAGFLLGRGNGEGNKFLEKSLDLSRKDITLKTQLLECLFYQYAHSKDENLQKESLKEIKALLKEGIRSPGWDLSDNVKKGIEDGHPQPEFLEKLSKVISEEAEIKELDNFEIWRELD